MAAARNSTPSGVGARLLWQGLFWVGLVLFLGWDWAASAPVDLRQEPPLIAAGSGQAASGGHCSMAK